MLKPITVSVGDVHQSSRAAASETVGNVFKVMHGFYGNLFLAKFSTGSLHSKDDKDADGQPMEGQDKGVISARGIWAHGLRGFDLSTVKTALQRCLAAHPEFPPTLPQFVALCKACAIRRAYVPAVPAIGMGQVLRSQYAATARAVNAKHAQKAADNRTGHVEVAPGLQGLFQAIAVAVGAAGGDEVQELQRFERLYPMVAA